MTAKNSYVVVHPLDDVVETKVDTEHFTLAPNEAKKLLTFPEHTHLTYEVSAFFKE